ncbi:hypothetical protein SAXI111661_19775 [Saccharomonospora xinjiangensis]|uniref:hypothetical protein n=1 Tax=Saccharomonospora xinjiangensis TaxID=75294 RepID=UPI0010704F83|nr:hypothetical protein [Saccharomonospora xinjiangensis]QBQ59122.1 hypothetical protein EYD13_03710 [Saccharomonospora xinjiangensis]
MAEPETVELTVAAPERGPVQEPARARVPVWRGVTGALVAGWGVVFLMLIVAQVAAWADEGEGPGAYSLGGHLVGIALAGGAQYVADRSAGPQAGLAGGAVALLSLTMLWLFWWS